MNILVVQSSPHKDGSSNFLASEFIRGASENGHQIKVVDVNTSNINPCQGCDKCGMNGDCVQDDDMKEILKDLLRADLLVMATPLYFYGPSAQLKIFIDRLYSSMIKITAKNLDTIFIATAWNGKDWAMDELENYYRALCRYMNFKDRGTILGAGCGNLPLTQNSDYPHKAYELGRSIN